MKSTLDIIKFYKEVWACKLKIVFSKNICVTPKMSKKCIKCFAQSLTSGSMLAEVDIGEYVE